MYRNFAIMSNSRCFPDKKIDQIFLLKAILRILFLLYYILGYIYLFTFEESYCYSRRFVLPITFDYLADIFFLSHYIQDAFLTWKSALSGRWKISCTNHASSSRRRSVSKNRVWSGIHLDEDKVDGDSGFGPVSVRSSIFLWAVNFLSITTLLPWEALAFSLDYDHYMYLRLLRLYHVIHLPEHWANMAIFIAQYTITTTANGVRAMAGAFVMAIIGHIAACMYYGIAISTMKRGNPISWLSRDNLAFINEENLGSVIYTSTSDVRYLRAFYWSMQTLLTVGYGDIVAYTDEETWFCICYFFVSAVMMYFSISNFELLITDRDAAWMKHLAKVSRFEKYAKYRQIPRNLIDRVKAHYAHQWLTLDGIEERKLVAELPSNIQQKISQSIFRKLFSKVKFFQDLNKVILNALATKCCKLIEFNPGDVVLAVDCTLSGAYLILLGDVDIFCPSSENRVKSKHSGDSFGLRALYGDFVSSSKHKASTFTEIVFIDGFKFRKTMQKLLSEVDFESMMDCLAKEEKEDVVELTPNLKGTLSSIVNDTSTVLKVKRFISESLNELGERLFSVFVIHPGSIYKMIWNVIILVTLLFYLFSVALLLRGTLQTNFYERFYIALSFSYLADIIMLLHYFWSMFLFPVAINGLIVDTPGDIRRHFLANENIPLLLLTLIPWDIIGVSIYEDSAIIPVLRLLKLFHLRYLNAYIMLFLETLYYFSISLSFEVLRCLQLYFYLFMLVHWAGCIWTLAADVSTQLLHYDTNWRIHDFSNSDISIGSDSTNGRINYIRSIYWALSGMTSIAYSDILPTNHFETVVVILVLFFGCQLLNGVDAGIASLIISFGKDDRDFRFKIERTQRMINYFRLSVLVESKVLRYYEYSWSKYFGLNESEILESIPSSLRGSIVDHFLQPIFEQVPIFSHCHVLTLEIMFAFLIPRCFLKDDVILISGEYNDELLVIEKGEAEITDFRRRLKFKTIFEGACIGENALIGVPMITSVYALTYCDTFTLSRQNFAKLKALFPKDSYVVITQIEKELARQEVDISIVLSRSSERVLSAAANEPRKSMRFLIGHNKFTSMFGNKIAPEISRRGFSDLSNSRWHPDSKFRQYWDSFLFVLLLFVALLTPLHVSISIPSFVFVLSYLSDVVFLVNTYFRCMKFYVFSAGELIFEPKRLHEKYFASLEFWIEAFASIPYDLLALIPSRGVSQATLRGLLRLPKLLRLMYLPHLSRNVERMLSVIGITTSAIKFVGLLLIIMYIGIYCSCGFYLMLYIGAPRHCNYSLELSPEIDASCQYRGTWLGFQMSNSRIERDGGSETDRFIMAMNWAFPTLTKETLSDVMPVNVTETLYVFLVMFFGVIINGVILGAIIALINDVNEESLSLVANLDAFQSRKGALKSVSIQAINRACGYLKFLISEEGSVIRNQQKILRQLPVSLQSDFDMHQKLHHLNHSLFSGFTQDLRKRIASNLQLRTYYQYDEVVIFGELGSEMFFIDKGSLDVISQQGELMSKLFEGAIFGETSLFFQTPRNATVRVSSQICVCYCLTKSTLDAELENSGFDEEATMGIFESIRSSNERRNTAIGGNLRKPKSNARITSLLGVNLSASHQNQIGDKVFSVAEEIRTALHPHSVWRIVWDIFGLIFLIFYAFSIPAEIAFLFGDQAKFYLRYLSIGFLIDAYWVLDIVLKCYLFSFNEDGVHNQLVISSTAIWNRYRNSWLVMDCIASVPLEIFAFLPTMSPVAVYVLRLNHLVRIFQFPRFLNLMEKKLIRVGVQLPRPSLLMVAKSACLYLVVVHWMSCIFFIIHRYMERGHSITFAIADNLATFNEEVGTHDVCNVAITRCYTRTLYFVLSTVTSIGYGDIQPYGNIELVWEIILSIIGALVSSLFGAYCSAYLADVNAEGNSRLRKKLRTVHRYIGLRNLDEGLAKSIIAHYNYMWNEHGTLSDEGSSVLDNLSEPLQLDIYFEMNARVILLVPMFNLYHRNIMRRISRAFEPQIVPKGGSVYDVDDIGSCFFVVARGRIKVVLDTQQLSIASMDKASREALPILRRKQSVKSNNIYSTGDHFGEFCMSSRSGCRIDTAYGIEESEVYTINHDRFWEALLYIDLLGRHRLIYDLMTYIGQSHHTEPKIDLRLLVSANEISNGNLFELAYYIMNKILNSAVPLTKDFVGPTTEDPEDDTQCLSTKPSQLLHWDSFDNSRNFTLHRSSFTRSDTFTNKNVMESHESLGNDSSTAVDVRRGSFSSKSLLRRTIARKTITPLSDFSIACSDVVKDSSESESESCPSNRTAINRARASGVSQREILTISEGVNEGEDEHCDEKLLPLEETIKECGLIDISKSLDVLLYPQNDEIIPPAKQSLSRELIIASMVESVLKQSLLCHQ